ncbi:MAG TPA: hypothetical protein VF123_20390 [Candidatus Sulfotelmatobacter sp.]
MTMPGKHRPSQKPPLTVPKPTLADLQRVEKQFNRAGADFLKVDVATAMTFAETALGTDDPVKKQRNRKSARKAYDTVLRMAKKIALRDADAKELKAGLLELNAKLRRLGETF